jgi:cytochrome c
MRVRVNKCFGVALTVLVVALSGAALAAGASKDEAVAMVKKAVAAIKAEGADKAYAEISNPQGPFVDRDLYIVVYGMDGVVLAHGADKKLVRRSTPRQGRRRQGIREGAG